MAFPKAFLRLIDGHKDDSILIMNGGRQDRKQDRVSFTNQGTDTFFFFLQLIWQTYNVQIFMWTNESLFHENR